MFYALVLDSNGNGIGSHAYAEEPSSYPTTEIACSQTQAQNPMMYQVVNGQIVASLTASQAAQITLIRNAANLAKTAPMSFTNGAGNTSSFPMDPVHQTEYLGAYSAFVLGGETLPSGFGFEDVNSVIIPMAVADIKAFYAQGVAGINAITAKKATLVSQINQATSISAVQAIVW